MNFFSLYASPIVKKIFPNFGNANERKKTIIKVYGKNFKCLTTNCEQLKCKFTFRFLKHESLITQGKFVSSQEIHCPVPFVNKPETIILSVSINERDYTSDEIIFTYFDPYIIKFEPSIISSTGFYIK